MSSQIQITGETKVKSLTGVLVGTSGVVSSLNIDGSLGIPQLDVNGKIIVSQLPNSVMEYKGTWDASTNTPTLVNGTGNQGDVYLCSVAGTVNFGAGAISFVVSDQVIYSGSIWQKASGSNGTVTSVAVTESGDSLNITGSPITTSGTINIGFNGTNLQYINGAGDLTTFPTLSGYVTSVTGTAPVVSSGGTTPAISMAAATTSVNGYLASADFTTFNNKQNAITLTTTGTTGAATLVGATLNIPNYGSALTGYVPYTGATQDVDLGAFKLNAQSLHIKGTAGNGHLTLKHQSASATASANEVSLFADVNGDLGWQNGNLYLNKFITSANTANRSYTFPNATGTVALTSDISYPVTSVFGRTGAVVATSGDYTTTLVTEGTNLYYTDVRARASNSFVAGSGAYNSTTGVITIPTNNNQITNGAGYTTNVGTVTSVAASGGTGISITGSPITTSGTITITNTAPDQTVALTASTGISVSGTYPNFTITNTSPSSGGTVTSVAALTLGTTGTDLSSSVATSTTTPVITLNVPTASATNRGALSSADWSTFNGKESALTFSSPLVRTINTISIPAATTSVNGYLTSTDWTTFNNKQSTITLTTTGTSGAATFSANTLNIPNYGSALSGYLPLTGGTLTGALSGTSASFSSTATATAFIPSGATIPTNGMYLSAANTLNFATNTTNRLTIDASGNLGLGVTPSAWVSFPSLQIGGQSAAFSGDANTTYSLANTYYSAGWKYVGTGYAAKFEIDRSVSSIYKWYNAPSGTAGAAITFTQAMTLTAAGRLLINTPTESTYQLDVNGTGRFQGDALYVYSTGSIEIGRDTTYSTPYMAVGFGGRSNGYNKIFGARDTTDGIYISAATGRGIKLETNGSTVTALTLASTGAATFSSSVSVATFLRASSGAQSNPTGGGSVVIDYQSTSDLQGRIRSRDWDGATWKNLTLEANNIILSPTGNVGIGTSSPSGKLHLSTTSDTYFVMTGGATPLTYSWLVDATNLRLFNGVGATTLLTIASTGAATFSSKITAATLSTIGTAVAATNVQLNLNGVSGKAQRIEFQHSGVQQWLIGCGSSSETNAFEIYNSTGVNSMAINKSTNAVTFAGNVLIGATDTGYKLNVNGSMYVSGSAVYAGGVTYSSTQTFNGLVYLNNTTQVATGQFLQFNDATYGGFSIKTLGASGGGASIVGNMTLLGGIITTYGYTQIFNGNGSASYNVVLSNSGIAADQLTMLGGLRIDTTTAGFIVPRMTTTQKNALPASVKIAGCIVYDTTSNLLQAYNGSTWNNLW